MEQITTAAVFFALGASIMSALCNYLTAKELRKRQDHINELLKRRTK